MVTHPACAPTAAPIGAGSLEPTDDLDRQHGREPVAAELPQHPALQGFWPSEQRAILWFRVELRSSLARRVSVEEAVQKWESGPAVSWRQEKMRIDGQRQAQEIERHKYLLSEQHGGDIGWDQAALDWVDKYARSWRVWWEDQPESLPDLLAFL